MALSNRFRQRLFAAVGSLALGGWWASDLNAQAPPAGRVTSAQFQVLIADSSPALSGSRFAGDAAFLRRACFDLIGRQPNITEQQQFVGDRSPTKRRDCVERLLASPEFGENWANYWSDTIAYRVPPPELTYLNFGPLKCWLAQKLNDNAPWDQITRELLTATGKIEEAPAATFIGYHQANPTNLAAETSRIFLGQQIGCAECHDHPFDSWKRTQFHELAAFFTRTKSKLSQNDGVATVVSAAEKGEYSLPDMADPRNPGRKIQPVFLDGTATKDQQSDAVRRAELAARVASPANRWFAKAYVNRIWSRLMGRGFYEPPDDLGDSRLQLLPEVHEALARHFVASGFDIKDLFRLIMNTSAYQGETRMYPAAAQPSEPIAVDQPLRLRGDEVFAALVVGVDLPNTTPAKSAPTDAIRFPPPPKSTRDLVNDAFGSDPSLAPADAPRTMSQALWMMNNEQLQKQIDATPASNTMLAKLLAEQPDNDAACQQLFQRVFSRDPTAEELRISRAHLALVGDRGAGFEDLLWSLVNSAEFTSRR